MNSDRGNEYIMVAYVYDPNVILVEPMKNRKENEIIQTYGVIHHRLQQYRFKPRYQKLDNEVSIAFQVDLSAKKIDFQLVSPNIHQPNAAERAILTFKNHSIAGLFNVHPNFPMKLWCRLLQQAEITLNLLRPSRLNPKLSAYAQLGGAFDFNHSHLVPPGVKTLVYETSSQRGSWSPHGVEGWYIGPAMKIHCCYRCYVPATASERTVETFSFFQHATPLYRISSIDAAIIAANDLTYILTHPGPVSPTMILGDDKIKALQQLSDIFKPISKRKKKLFLPLKYHQFYSILKLH